MGKLGLDEIRPPFVELIKAIDEHKGSSAWREICFLQVNQDAMMKRLFENYEDGQAWASPLSDIQGRTTEIGIKMTRYEWWPGVKINFNMSRFINARE